MNIFASLIIGIIIVPNAGLLVTAREMKQMIPDFCCLEFSSDNPPTHVMSSF